MRKSSSFVARRGKKPFIINLPEPAVAPYSPPQSSVGHALAIRFVTGTRMPFRVRISRCADGCLRSVDSNSGPYQPVRRVVTKLPNPRIEKTTCSRNPTIFKSLVAVDSSFDRPVEISTGSAYRCEPLVDTVPNGGRVRLNAFARSFGA